MYDRIKKMKRCARGWETKACLRLADNSCSKMSLKTELCVDYTSSSNENVAAGVFKDGNISKEA